MYQGLWESGQSGIPLVRFIQRQAMESTQVVARWPAGPWGR